MSEKIKTYETDELTIYWRPDLCEHAKECVHGAPSVFNPDKRPWITPNASDSETLKKTIDRCPSKALSYEERKTTMIEIKFEDSKNRAAAYDNDKNIGESTFSKSETMWIIDHTAVDENYGGQGIAGKLVAIIVEEARKQGVKIMPLCPFAKREFDKKSEYHDVLLGK